MNANALKALSMLAAGAMALAWPGCSGSERSQGGGALKGSEFVQLPPPKLDGSMSLEKAILQRRSVRTYTSEPLTISQISQLLWAAQGVTEPKRGLRSAPSAGALYPLEVYVVAGKVDGLAPGVYKYHAEGHKLLKTADKDKRAELVDAALGQSCVRDAPASIVFSAVYERTRARYGERASRYVHIETGHAAENVCLQAVALKLGSVCVGAFDDSEVRKVLSLPSEEQPLYILPVGRRKS